MFPLPYIPKLLMFAVVSVIAFASPLLASRPIMSALTLFCGVLMAAVVSERRALRHDRSIGVAKDWESDKARRSRALVIGAGSVGRSLAQSLLDDGYDVVGFIDNDFGTDTHDDLPILGGREEVRGIVRRHCVDEVFVAYAPSWQHQVAEELVAVGASVGVHVVPSPFDSLLQTGRMENRGDIALVRMCSQKGGVYDTIKRAGDLVLSTILIVLTAPITLPVALLIRLTSPGSAVFSQERIGRAGEVFILYKFRTMVSNAEDKSGPVLADGVADSRLTAIGKWLKIFRIDELPQLWNVIRGEMSLVGPRPERPVFVSRFVETSPTYAQRHQVRPGITGLAQVCGGYHTHWRDKLRFDLYYISHRSLWMDISVIFRTLLLVIPGRHK